MLPWATMAALALCFALPCSQVILNMVGPVLKVTDVIGNQCCIAMHCRVNIHNMLIINFVHLLLNQHTVFITSCLLSNLMFALFDLVAIITLCPNANIANTQIRLFAVICIVRLILKLRELHVILFVFNRLLGCFITSYICARYTSKCI